MTKRHRSQAEGKRLHKVRAYLKEEFGRLDRAYSQAHEKIKPVTLPDGTEIEAIDWREPPRDHEAFGAALEAIEEEAEERADQAKRASQRAGEKRKEATKKKGAEYQRLADKIWAKNPDWLKSRVAEAVRRRTRSRDKRDTIERYIVKRRVQKQI
jgi:hypothetical protein